jgi:hypothetical protein
MPATLLPMNIVIPAHTRGVQDSFEIYDVLSFNNTMQGILELPNSSTLMCYPKYCIKYWSL